jgi:hypothetical protein
LAESPVVGEKEVDEDKTKTNAQHLKTLSMFSSVNSVNLNLINNENINSNNNDASLSENKISACSLTNSSF